MEVAPPVAEPPAPALLPLPVAPALPPLESTPGVAGSLSLPHAAVQSDSVMAKSLSRGGRGSVMAASVCLEGRLRAVGIATIDCLKPPRIAENGAKLRSMRGVGLDELRQEPVGAYVSGRCFAHGCLHPALWALLIWGRPDEAIARALGRSLVVELAPPAAAHGSIIDTSRLEGGERGTFELLEAYLTHYSDELARWVQRVALVRPRGLSGAIVSGAFEVAPRPFPVRLFDERLAALEWLHGELAFEPGPPDALSAIDEMFAAADAPPIIRELRDLLAARLRGISIEDAAGAMALSPRTLQRRLSDAGTTFQDELADARVRAAQRMLAESDTPVTAIAFDVGFASPQHLSALFKKRTATTPSEWRRKRRG